MKKYIFMLLVVGLFLWTGCEKTVQENKYYAEQDEKSYCLILREDGTFLLTESVADGEREYGGTFEQTKGMYVLQGETLGKKTVLLTENGFSFLADLEPEEKKEEEACSHVWGVGIYTAPKNCLEQGNTEYTCSLCGEKKTVYGAVKGEHDFKTETINGKNCLAKKVIISTCKLCGEAHKTESEVLSDNHSYLITEETDGANCLSNVKTKYVCSLCKDSIYREYDEKASGTQAHIGTHNFQNGLCQNCGYRDNGFSSVHIDKNGDGKCDNCDGDMVMLQGITQTGYYEKEDMLYFGVFPQKVSSVKKGTLLAEGRYDADRDCYYYHNETYRVKTNTVNVTFSDGTTGKRGEESIYIVTPIAWKKTSNNSYVCSVALDGKKFLDEVYLKEKDGSYYSDLATTLADNYEGSSIKRYIDKIMAKAFSSTQAVYWVSTGLCAVADCDKVAEVTGTDYALASGLSVKGGVCSWYLADLVHTEKEDGKYVSYRTALGTVDKCAVTDIRGVVPQITVQWNIK